MIAEVIPYTKTKRGKDFFDYAIPDELRVQRGSYVTVPFRSSSIPGIVRSVKEQSTAKKLKAIVSVDDNTSWSHERIQLLEWFASHYFISHAHALKLFLSKPLKRARKIEIQSQRKTTNPTLLLQKGGQHILQYANIENRGKHYGHSLDGHTLVIIPEQHDAVNLERTIEQDNVITVLDPSPSMLHALTELLHESDANYSVITTRKTALLILHLCSTIILDQEEAKAHKQFDQNPRYHMRSVLLQHHTLQSNSNNAPTIIYASHCPTSTIEHAASEHTMTRIDLRGSWNQEAVAIVDMDQEKRNQNYSWFSETLIQQITNSSKTLLLFNRTGEYGTALCKDCSTLLSPTTSACTSCKGTNIQRMRKGTRALENELHTLFANKRVLRVDREQQELSSEELKGADIIVATEKIFRLLPFSHFDLIGVLSVDHQLTYPHFRAHERTFQLLLKVFASGRTTLLQTHAPHNPVIRFAAHGNYKKFMKGELSLRKMLQLPPFAPRLHVIDTKTKKRVTVSAVTAEMLATEVVIDREE